MLSNPKRVDLSSMTCFYQGSVQNLYTIAEHPHLLVSETTKTGSVFDVGALYSINESDVYRACFRHYIYQQLSDKQAWISLASQMQADGRWHGIESDPVLTKLFARLQEQGAQTHHMGMIDASSGEVLTKGFPQTLSNLSLIERYQVHQPDQHSWASAHFYDYNQSIGCNQHVIPLEFIVRFGVASSSSLLSRYHNMADNQRVSFLRELGVNTLEPWQRFSVPINDCSSKYEPEDRALRLQEAALISGLNGQAFCNSLALATLASLLLESYIQPTGLLLWDVKWEIARKGDSLVIVDTIDTDSMRLTLEVECEGLPCLTHYSKQAMRDYYQIMHPQWCSAVVDAKQQSTQKGESFVSVFHQGQQSGRYPNHPTPDNEFMIIQEEKMQLIKDTICLQKKPHNNAFHQFALNEVDYYLRSNKGHEFQKHNGL